ncbi:MAG: transglutaminase domain-containing protein [Chitinispirillaceae bacterium]|nr:transglutaminase domain-containing protein [Chitinispirillaceae bacterium]
MKRNCLPHGAAAVITTALLMGSGCQYRPPGTVTGVLPMQDMINGIPDQWREDPVIILADTVINSFHYSESGNSVKQKECVWYYINNKHPELLKTIVVYDFETMETRPGITCTFYYPDHKKRTVSSMEFKRFRGEDEEYFRTNKMVNLYEVPRYQQGLLIRLEIARNIVRPAYLRAEILRNEYHSLEKRVTLTWPEDGEIGYHILNNELLPVDSSASASRTLRSVTLTGARLEKIPGEYAVRFPELWFAGLHFSLPPKGKRSMSWKEIGDYYLDLIAPSMTSSPAVRTMAQSVTARGTPAMVEQAFSLLQRRVRYIAMEQEIYAIVPRTASEVCQKGYGDCKEMSVLLTMILAEKGIPANLALVATEERFQAIDSIPTLGAFNHMIIHLPDFDGRPVFLDPTVRFGHSRNSYYHLLHRKALVLEPGNSRLEHIAPRPNEGIARIATSSVIGRDRTNRFWEMKGAITLYDRAAYMFYPFIQELKGEENNPGLIAVLKRLFAVEPTSVALDKQSSDSIRVTYTGRVSKQYVTIDKGGFILETPSAFGGPGTFTTIRREGPRVFEALTQHDEWIMPDGFTDLESMTLDHPIGKGDWRVSGNTVTRNFSMVRTVAGLDGEDSTQEFLRLQKKFFRATIWRN